MDDDGRLAQFQQEYDLLQVELYTPKSGKLRKGVDPQKVKRFQELKNYLDVMEGPDGEETKEMEAEVLVEVGVPNAESIHELPWDLQQKAKRELRRRKQEARRP